MIFQLDLSHFRRVHLIISCQVSPCDFVELYRSKREREREREKRFATQQSTKRPVEFSRLKVKRSTFAGEELIRDDKAGKRWESRIVRDNNVYRLGLSGSRRRVWCPEAATATWSPSALNLGHVIEHDGIIPRVYTRGVNLKGTDPQSAPDYEGIFLLAGIIDRHSP